jgi:hypothetical protein
MQIALFEQRPSEINMLELRIPEIALLKNAMMKDAAMHFCFFHSQPNKEAPLEVQTRKLVARFIFVSKQKILTHARHI